MPDFIKQLLVALKFLDRMDVYRQKLYSTAVSKIGKDASPNDLAKDEVGCMETASMIIREAFPELRFPIYLSTIAGHKHFSDSLAWKEVDVPISGGIMMAVTGSGNGKVSNGHICIIGKNTAPDGTLWAMSNDSRSGTWEVNYTVASFKRYYGDRGGMPIRFFVRI